MGAIVNGLRPGLDGTVVVVLWAAAVGLGAVAVSSLAGIRAGWVVNVAQTLVPLGFVGSLAILLTAIGLGSWPLASVTLAVVGAHLALVVPAIRPRPPAQEGGGRGARLRVFTANLRFGNADASTIAGEILQSDADVVALQELTEAHLASLRAEGVLDVYPHAFIAPGRGAVGSAILSRSPLQDARTFDLEGLPQSTAVIAVGGRSIRLLNIHTMSPIGRSHFDRRDHQLAALARLVASLPDADVLVLAGDFNANRWHPAFRRLLHLGLRDAHEQAGRGLARTWPNGTRLFPFALLDHVLVSPPVTVVAVREGAGHGSDHRPVVADLVLG